MKIRALFILCATALVVLSSTVQLNAEPVPTRKPVTITIPLPAHKPVAPVAMRAPISVAGEGMQALSTSDLEHYKAIASLQEQGNMREADRHYKKLKDTRLLGHMLYQRYMHPTAYKSKFSELKSWLERYSDHVGAKRIYKLANRKKPAGFNGRLTKPAIPAQISRVAEPTMAAAKTYRSPSHSAYQRKMAAKKIKQIRHQIKTSQITTAVNNIKAQDKGKTLDSIQVDQLKGRLSSSYLYGGYIDEARKTSREAVKRSGTGTPEAAWVAGLVAWYEGRYNDADGYFELAANSPYASGWDRAGAAYWAARAHMRNGNVKEVSPWLKKAAAHPRTFYGLLATRALGQDFGFNWDMPKFTKEHYNVLAASKSGARALALEAVGLQNLAEAELLRVDTKQPKMGEAALSFAHQAGLSAVSMRLGAKLSKTAAKPFDAALYPRGYWQPQGGYKANKDLIHAIIRQESHHNPHAKSGSGARGLMQLMPATAKQVAKKLGINLDDLDDLNDPQINLALGQDYLGSLLSRSSVSGDLTALLIAYNAGPGNLARWQKRWSGVYDPLLFIELLPSSQTRHYVESVLANLWIYRLRDGNYTPTLTAMSEGKTPLYAALYQPQKFRVATRRASRNSAASASKAIHSKSYND